MRSDEMRPSHMQAPAVNLHLEQFSLPELFEQIDKAKLEVDSLSYYFSGRSQHGDELQRAHSGASSDCVSGSSGSALLSAPNSVSSCSDIELPQIQVTTSDEQQTRGRAKGVSNESKHPCNDSNHGRDDEDDNDDDEEIIDIEGLCDNNVSSTSLSASGAASHALAQPQSSLTSALQAQNQTEIPVGHLGDQKKTRQSLASLLVRHMVQKRNLLKLIDKQLIELIAQLMIDLSTDGQELATSVSAVACPDSRDYCKAASSAVFTAPTCCQLAESTIANAAVATAPASSVSSDCYATTIGSHLDASSYVMLPTRLYDHSDTYTPSKLLASKIPVDLTTSLTPSNRVEPLHQAAPDLMQAPMSAAQTASVQFELPQPQIKRLQSQAINLKKSRLLANIVLNDEMQLNRRLIISATPSVKTSAEKSQDKSLPPQNQDNPLNLLSKNTTPSDTSRPASTGSSLLVELSTPVTATAAAAEQSHQHLQQQLYHYQFQPHLQPAASATMPVATATAAVGFLNPVPTSNLVHHLAEHYQHQHQHQQFHNLVSTSSGDGSTSPQNAAAAVAVAAARFKVSHKCQVCGSFFEDRHRLQQHLSIHLQLDKNWYIEATIKKTMAQYESKRGDYLCNVCDLRFATTSTFDKHMQMHGEKPHRCELCFHDNSFRFYRQYLTHYRNHCVIYKCKFIDNCNHQCNRRDYLKSHILKHHLNNKLPPQYTIYCQ